MGSGAARRFRTNLCETVVLKLGGVFGHTSPVMRKTKKNKVMNRGDSVTVAALPSNIRENFNCAARVSEDVSVWGN